MAPTVPDDRECSNGKIASAKYTRKFIRMEDIVKPNNTVFDETTTSSVVQLSTTQLSKESNITNDKSDCQYVNMSINRRRQVNKDYIAQFNKENENPQINQDQIVEHVEKKMKMEESNEELIQMKPQVEKSSVIIDRCEYCRQKLNNEIRLYQGHPNHAIEEQIALTDPKLCLFTGDEDSIHESDARPQNKVTYFR